MEFGWLLHGVGGLIGQLPSWLGHTEIDARAALVGVIVLLVALSIFLRRRRRQVEQVQAERVRDEATLLKSHLRQRLSEPVSLFASGVNAAPTMGASEAFEGDIEAAARTVMVEAEGHRSRAKHLLRKRMMGQGESNAKLNGSEVGYWRQLGALSLLDGPNEALPAYVRAADLAPENAEAQMLAGVLYLRTGNLDAAEAAFRRQIALGDAANGSADGGIVRYRGQTMLGDVLAAREEHDDARAAYAQAQREVKSLLERDSEHVGLKRDLSVTYDRIGDMHVAKSEVDAALDNYRHSLEIAEALAKSDPRNMVWQHDLSVSHERIGDLLEKKGDREGALANFQKSLEIAKALATRDPDNVQWQWDASASHDRIGDALIAQGKLKDALSSYRRGLEIAETLAKRDPAHAGWQRDLAVSYHKIGSLEAINDPTEARELLEKGRAIIDRLAKIAAHQAQWRSDLARFDDVLRGLD